LMNPEVARRYSIGNSFIIFIFSAIGTGIAFLICNYVDSNKVGLALLIGFIFGFMIGDLIVLMFRK
jgi:hypothetical protein